MTVTMDDVRRALREVYTPEGVELWLAARQKRWDYGTAAEMVRKGHGAEVLAAIERLAMGAHE